MAFNDLIAGKGKGPSEEGRLNILVKTYEQENNELKKQLDISKGLEKEVLKLLEDNNKEKFDLQRQVKSLEKNLQIEKKVAGVYEFDSRELKDDNRTMKEKITKNTKRILELESALNDERIKRLRDIHEIELLRRKNAELDAREKNAKNSELTAQEDVLKKLQSLQTVIAQNTLLQQTVDMQAAEINHFTKEQFQYKESIKGLSESVLSLEGKITEITKERDILQEEVWRLRKDLLSIAQGPGQQSLAYSTRSLKSRGGSPSRGSSPSRGGSRAGTSGTRSSNSRVSMLSQTHNTLPKMQQGSTLTAVGGRSVSDLMVNTSWDMDTLEQETPTVLSYDTNYDKRLTAQRSGELSPVVSPMATPYRPYTSAAYNFRGSRLGDNDSITKPSTASVSFAEDPHVFPDRSSTAPSTAPNIYQKKPDPNSVSIVDRLSKSMYVGSGLGLKRSEGVVTSKGGAKQMLKKIMDDFNANN